MTRCALAVAHHGAEPFAEIALVGGRLYVEAMRFLVRGFVEMGCVRRDARVSVINGPIGRMRRDLRAWPAATPARGDPVVTGRLGHNGRPALEELADPRRDYGAGETPPELAHLILAELDRQSDEHGSD